MLFLQALSFAQDNTKILSELDHISADIEQIKQELGASSSPSPPPTGYPPTTPTPSPEAPSTSPEVPTSEPTPITEALNATTPNAYAAKGSVNAGNLTVNSVLPLPITIDGKPVEAKMTLDANWRYVHDESGKSCYEGEWDATLCPDAETCSKNCVIEGIAEADYSETYGITTNGSQTRLNYVTGNSVGSRNYLMNAEGDKYLGFNVVNREFSFTVDVTTLGCGLNGALYFSEMPLDGLLPAGAAYGTGYGDAQCPTDVKFVGGLANTDKTGSCSNEYDIWEANSVTNAFTAHPCSITEPSVPCTGDSCNVCDKAGADYNSYRLGNTTLYGKGNQVDTTKPFEVVTQFITSDGTDNGDLVRIQRYYVQGGKNIDGGFTTDESAAANFKKFPDKTPNTAYAANGGMKSVGDTFKRGNMVLVLSIWDDAATGMEWLDSTVGTGDGSKRGPCPVGSGDSTALRASSPSSYVTYADIKLNPISEYK